jgi:hypothetical protein
MCRSLLCTHGSKALDFLVRGPEGGEPKFLGELRERGISQHGYVAEQLVDAVPIDIIRKRINNYNEV